MGENYPTGYLEERVFYAEGRARRKGSKAGVFLASSGNSKTSKTQVWVKQTSKGRE